MSQRDDRFALPGLLCFVSATDRDSWHFVPLQAQVQRNDLGDPITSLVETGAGSFLMVSAVWQAAADELEAMRDLIRARRAPDDPPVRISFAPVENVRCDALMGDGQGAFEILSSGTTSGFPPYQALFNLTLEPDALRCAHLGLDGRPGWLGVEYRAALPTQRHSRAVMRARSADFLPWLRERLSGGAVSAELIEQAVALGLVEITIDMDGDALSDLMFAQRQALIAALASALRPRFDGAGDQISIAVELDYSTSEDIRAFADIGVLIADASHNRIGGRHAAD